jgi:hypothetical protein
MAENELIALQVAPESPKPESIATKTDMVMPPVRAVERMRHFPEEVYDLSAESHLTKFVKVLLGDAGAGQLRKRLLITRMQNTIQGTHFYDLDRFYGPLFGLRRTQDEVLDFDPYSQTALAQQWDEATAKDSSFRSRIEQFAKALTYGPTVTGMELIAEALLSVDCDVYESYIQADSSYQTYAELEDQYGEGTPGGFYSDMEDVSYGTLEGEQLARLSGNDRRVFTIRPKRRISLAEAHDLRRVIERVKPADARLLIDVAGIPLHDPLSIQGAVADSVHWEVLSQVAAPQSPMNPYQVSSGTPVEQPRPPFAGYQGEAWSYNSDLTGISASYRGPDGLSLPLPVQRVTFPDFRVLDFSPEQAVLPRRMVQGGRVVSDAILVAHPYSGPRGVPTIFEDRYIVQRQSSDVARLYADGIPLDALNALLKEKPEVDPFQQNPEHRYWVGEERWMDDPTEEVLEVRLSGERWINYLSFEMAKYPHEIVAEVYEVGSGAWTEVFRRAIYISTPHRLDHGTEVTQKEGHPMHSLPNHWERVGVRTPAVLGSRLRLRLRRVMGTPPERFTRVAAIGSLREPVEVPYSLALRSLDLGYRVTSRADFQSLPPVEGGVIGSTRDVAGSLTQFTVREFLPANLLTGSDTYWRSEPQPVNYAVVNLYLDTRGPGNGDGTVIDRFFLDPTHAGAHLSLYYSNDPEETDGTDEFFAERAWTPIPRDYTLQRGYVHLPPTRARYWKFEFTNLVAEPYESFLAVNRKVRLFPRSLVEQMHRGTGSTALPTEMLSAVEVVRESRYSDALALLGVPEPPPAGRVEYLATEAIYLPDLNLQQRLRQESWVFGFTPWHQGDQAPRFSVTGRHVYEEVEVRHTTKVAFFVGLKAIQAFRTNWEEDDDTQVYFDTFDDFRNLEPGFTWAFEPGFLTTSGTVHETVEATSRTFSSRHNVMALQFATEQANPQQLVPDHDFRDPALGTYEWNDGDSFTRVGDAQLIYSPSDHSVLHLRYVVPPPKAVDHTGGLVQPIHSPVFYYRPYEVADEVAAALTEGGIATPLLGLSPEGRAYAAARFTMNSDMTNPLWLQVVDANDEDALLVERSITARRGETVEEYLPFDIPGPGTVVKVRLIQKGKSNDAWRLDTLSMFDDGIVWEFSVNGGGDWYPALGIRNNDNGVLTFPEVGNQLRFRVRGHRARMWVSAIKIRPWYVGQNVQRPTGTHRGPNLSVYDSDVPIHEDPMFTAWKKPVPYWWYAASRRFPILPVEGAPNITEFARFYGRPSGDDIPEATDSVQSRVIQRRFAEEWIPLEGDWASRPLPLNWRIVRPIVGPIGPGEIEYGI